MNTHFMSLSDRLPDSRLYGFVVESNRIENIHRDPTDQELQAHDKILGLKELTVKDLEEFVAAIAGVSLRRNPGQNVIVGGHMPPSGGPDIEPMLKILLIDIMTGELGPYEAHQRYEQLHPFMDGNGRSGRVLWAWRMRQEGQDPFALSFLHRWYYQSLDAQRRG